MSIDDYRDRGYTPTPKQPEYYEERLQCEPRPKMREDYGRNQICPEVKSYYGAFDAIDRNDMLINELNDRLQRLRNCIEPILETTPETAAGKDSPRQDVSTLVMRMNTQAYSLENLNVFVEELISRVRL